MNNELHTLFTNYRISGERGITIPDALRKHEFHASVDTTIAFESLVRTNLSLTDTDTYSVEIFNVDDCYEPTNLLAHMSNESIVGVTHAMHTWLNAYQQYIDFLANNITHVDSLVYDLLDKGEKLPWDEFCNLFPTRRMMTPEYFVLRFPLSPAFALELSVFKGNYLKHHSHIAIRVEQLMFTLP